MQLLTCISHFETQVPDACCVYAPLALVNLSEVISAYTPDDVAKLAIFNDYLNGLSYLHEQKSIMHRDISLGNLAVLSIHQPKGIIIDLDAATTNEFSTDHMKGTLPYLAPEIIDLKGWDGLGEQPPPYSRTVDTWALGLTMYALYTGRSFSWRLFDTFPAGKAATVTKEAHMNFQERLTKKVQAAEDPNVRLSLDLITGMTEWELADRLSASEALSLIPENRSRETRGLIMPKEAQKRQREDD